MMTPDREFCRGVMSLQKSLTKLKEIGSMSSWTDPDVWMGLTLIAIIPAICIQACKGAVRSRGGYRCASQRWGRTLHV
jgi:hypothetical protein